MQKPTTKQKLSLRKKAGFAVLSIGFFFLCLEGLLALTGVETSLQQADPYVGFEASVPLFVEEESSNGPFLKTASNKLTYFNSQRFPKAKPTGTFRIFCLGGSTTFGRPYDDTTSFSAWLRELLGAAGSDRTFEVINAGGISYASYRVATLMEELSRYSPDLFIVYCGHNEFLEERTYGDLRDSSKTSRGLSLLLHRTRTFQLMRSLYSDPAPANSGQFILPAEVDAILDHTAGPISYHRDDQQHRKIIEHFQFNLSRMVQTARDAGAELVFVTPAANIKDFSPFKSEQLSTLSREQRAEWTSLVTDAAEFETTGDIRKAIEKLEAAVRIDPRHAEVRYQLGLLLFHQRQYPAADTEFQAAIDNDICPLRAVSEIREIVRQTAAAQHVPLVDFEEILRDESLRTFGYRSPGNVYFFDHVHLTIGGHRLLAMALLEAMIQLEVFTPHEPWRDEAVEFATRQIESRIDPDLNALALTNLSQVLNWAGKIDEAGRLAIEAVDLRAEHQLDDDPESLFYAAKYLETSGETSRARELFERVLQLRPNINQARWQLARLLIQAGLYQLAKRELQILVTSKPDNSRFLLALGQVLLKLEQFDESRDTLEQARAIDPELPGLRELLVHVRQHLDRRSD